MKKLATILILLSGLALAAPTTSVDTETDSAEGSPKVIMVKGTNSAAKPAKSTQKIAKIKNHHKKKTKKSQSKKHSNNKKKTKRPSN